MAQTKYIGIGTLIVSVSLLITWFASRPDFKVDFSPNITCSGECVNPSDSDCVQYFNLTSLSKKFYIKNKGNFNLPFTEPERVKSFQVYRADLRYKSDNPNRWRAVNLSKGLTLNINVTNEFRINLCKNSPNDVIKWGLEGIGINEDPIFLPIEKAKKECRKKLSSKNIYQSEIRYINKTNCSDEPLNKSCAFSSYSYKYDRFIGKSAELIDDECIKVRDKIINYGMAGFKCNPNCPMECDSCFDGNCNGICTSGESCIHIDCNDFSMNSRLDSKELKPIEIE